MLWRKRTQSAPPQSENPQEPAVIIATPDTLAGEVDNILKGGTQQVSVLILDLSNLEKLPTGFAPSLVGIRRQLKNLSSQNKFIIATGTSEDIQQLINAPGLFDTTVTVEEARQSINQKSCATLG